MAIEIEDIDSREKLHAYLKDKSKTLSKIITLRCSLRVLPMLNSAFESNYDKAEELTSTVFRANIISWVARKYPTHDMGNAAGHAANAAANAAGHAAGSKAAYYAAGHAANAAANAAGHAAYYTADAADAKGVIWESVQNDLKLYENASNAKKDADVLLNARLWRDGLPKDLIKWPALRVNLLNQQADWDVWTDWYSYILAGRRLLNRGIALLSEKALVELAQKPNEFWEREPKKVNAEIKAMIDGAGSEVLEEETIEVEAEELSSANQNAKNTFSAEQIKTAKNQIATNKVAINLTIESLLIQISEYREGVRGNNQLEPEFRESLLNFLDNLKAQLETLATLLSELEEVTDDDAEEVLGWNARFMASFKESCAEYFDPINLGGVGGPAAIVLTFGALGGMIAGGTGLGNGIQGIGVGALIGGLITREMKPRSAVEKSSKLFDNDAEPDK